MSLIYGFRDHERFVYHYTRASVARDYILKDKTLRLSSFARTNDPRETKQWEFNLKTRENRDLGKYMMGELSQWFSAALKSTAKLACFCLDHGPLTGDHTRDILNRGFAKPRMWAQYAGNHTGVCLVFERMKLIDAIRETFGTLPYWAGPVTYQNHYFVRGLTAHEFMIDIDQLESLGRDGYLGAHLQEHYKALFFEKLLDWRDEAEWRLVLQANSEVDMFLPIGDALVGIMHGASIDHTLSDEILMRTDGQRIEHMGLTWYNSNPWYDLGSYRWSVESRKSHWLKL